MRCRHSFLFLILIAVLFFSPIFAGAPTLKTININGNMQDWSEVLTNPNNVTIDGASATNCANSTDKDCPVQSTGKDMVKFAWTYDSTNIYLYVERVGSSSNVQNFFFIMDVGQDKYANSTDFVLHVSYQGSNRSTNLTLYKYSPLNPSGDPLVNGSGFADGYDMPGSLVSIPSGDPSYFVVTGITGGSQNGSTFETYVPWSKLLVSSGTPIFFHVASGNNSSLSQVDDNLGGPGGGIGAFAYYWVQIYPDNTSSVSEGQNVTYTHTVKNNGSFNDRVDLHAISSNSLPISFFSDGNLMATDVNGNGSFEDAGDYVNPSYDSNSDGKPDFQLSAWTSKTLQIEVETSLLPSNSYDSTKVYAVSGGDGSYSSAEDKTYIGDLIIYPDNNISGTPSDYVNLNHTLRNYREDDYIKLSLISSLGFSYSLYKGSDLIGTDNGGDGIWDYVNPSYDYNSDNFPDVYLTQGSSISLTLYCMIPSGATIGSTESVTISANGYTNQGSSSCSDTIQIKPAFTFSPTYSLTNSTEKYGAAGHPLFFSHKIQNNTSTAKKFTFYATGYAPYNDSSWQMTLYSDPNGDGNPSDGSVINYTDSIPEMGGEYNIVVEVLVPSTVSPPATANSSVTAVECLNSDCSSYDTNVKASVEEDVRVSYIVPFEDALWTIQQRNFSPCQTLYSKAFNVVANQTGRYRVKILDPSSNIIRDVAKNSDSSGSFTDEYQFPATSVSGTYSLQLIDNTTTLDTAHLAIERGGSVLTSLSQIGRNLSDSLSFYSTLFNQNSSVNYKSTKLWHLVKDPTNSLYLKEDGTWGTVAGGVYTKITQGVDLNAQDSCSLSSGFASVTFPAYGKYTLCSTWEFSCGSLSDSSDNIATNCSYFYVVSLNSYSDSSYSIPKEQFLTSESIYFMGEGYDPLTSYNVGIYKEDGSRQSYGSKISESDGKLLYQIASSTLQEGNYKIVVFPNGVEPPLTFNSTYAYKLSEDSFSVFQIVLLRFGGVTSLNPITPPKSEIFINYPADPSLSLERDAENYGFISGTSFSHDVTDLESTPPLVFYQLYGLSGDTMRVSKDGGKITITY